MLEQSQGGHLSANPLQPKSVIPFYKSSYAHSPLWKAVMETVQGGHDVVASLVKGLAFKSLLLGCSVPI